MYVRSKSTPFRKKTATKRPGARREQDGPDAPRRYDRACHRLGILRYGTPQLVGLLWVLGGRLQLPYGGALVSYCTAWVACIVTLIQPTVMKGVK